MKFHQVWAIKFQTYINLIGPLFIIMSVFALLGFMEIMLSLSGLIALFLIISIADLIYTRKKYPDL